jgi:hypothetical protein
MLGYPEIARPLIEGDDVTRMRLSITGRPGLERCIVRPFRGLLHSLEESGCRHVYAESQGRYCCRNLAPPYRKEKGGRFIEPDYGVNAMNGLTIFASALNS